MAMHVANSSGGWSTVRGISSFDGTNWTTGANAAIWDGSSWVGFLDKVTLSNDNVINNAVGVASAAQWTLESTGIVNNSEGQSAVWCQNSNNTDLYESLATWTWTNQNGGSFSGTLSPTTVPLGSGENRYICSKSGIGESEGVLSIQIRNIQTQQVLASATINLTAIVSG